MAKKKHIPLFDDQLEMLELLTDQEVGQAVLAAMRFMRSGTETDLTGGAGVVYQVLRAQFIRNQNDAAVGKKGGRPRKSPAETPVSEAETTERNETEPDGTGQDGTEPDETESDRTGGGDGSAGGRFVPPTLDEVRPESSSSRSAVQQALISADFTTSKQSKSRKTRAFRDFLISAAFVLFSKNLMEFDKV